MRRLAALLVPLVVAVALTAACAGSEDDAPPVAGGEEAWLALLADQGLTPDPHKVEIAVVLEDRELAVTITVPSDAPGQLPFGDGLYGATAYTFADGAWKRVDTADIRTEIAPLLGPGESADVRLPVEEADSYRVLVPVEGAAAWADSA
jgi:hypothetical protein